MEENANKLHFKYFNSSMRVTVYAECIYVLTEHLKYLSIRRRIVVFFRSAAACQLCLCPATNRQNDDCH